MLKQTDLARPFLKWAGGKGQLLTQLEAHLPQELREGKIRRYIEPFLGGGAMFFYLAQHYQLEEFYLLDINAELILIYQVVQKDCEALIKKLDALNNKYLAIQEAERKYFYYQIRQAYNCGLHIVGQGYSSRWIERAAQAIFLNKTCYNGLYRLNSKGQFNVPFGRYKKPSICDAENLRLTSGLLQGVRLKAGDFKESVQFADEATFVYCDPPYRPISRTANFTTYAANGFGDQEQISLAECCRQMTAKGTKVMVSNSDPKNLVPEDTFFEDIYTGFEINRVKASRMINCDSTKRGEIWELVITNYPVHERATDLQIA